MEKSEESKLSWSSGGRSSGTHKSTSGSSSWQQERFSDSEDDQDHSQDSEDSQERHFNQSRIHLMHLTHFACLSQEICRFCPDCADGGIAVPMMKNVWSERGSALILNWTCLKGHEGTWESQPILCYSNKSKVYEGNVCLAASIELCGATYQPMAEWAESLGLAFIGPTIFKNLSRHCLLKVVDDAWRNEQKQQIEEMADAEVSEGGLCLAADGQFESPGYSSTHGTVSFMDLHSQKILEFSVLKKTEEGVGTSHAIETVGFKNGLNSVIDCLGLDVSAVCTDQNLGIQKLMRVDERFSKISHELDIWHFAKRLSKEMDALGKNQGI